MRIALLTYRGNPLSGGQGVYVRYLSRAMVAAGHEVEVFSGPPYPDLAEGVRLREVPSLDLYREDDPFRTPRRDEFRDWVDVLEFGAMCTAAFPEPLTFSLRVARILAAERHRFDVVHDNQGLGYGLLRLGTLPVVATIHHPCSIDRDLAIAAATGWKKKLSLRRWYAFTRMQARVARRVGRLITVSQDALSQAIDDFDVDASTVDIIPNGVDAELFRPLPHVERHPGRIVTTASADVPLKGLVYLIEAVAKLRTERDVHLVVVGKAARDGDVTRAIDRFGLNDAISFRHDLSWEELVELYATSSVAVVPSLYEGFSLPAIEAMSCGVPLVATTAGALPEVVGDAAASVPPRDAGALAQAIAGILDDPVLARSMSLAGRARVLDRFGWEAAARATVDAYVKAGASC